VPRRRGVCSAVGAGDDHVGPTRSSYSYNFVY
jgi:hypothetical protein